eukprot:gene7040-987_t
MVREDVLQVRMVRRERIPQITTGEDAVVRKEAEDVRRPGQEAISTARDAVDLGIGALPNPRTEAFPIIERGMPIECTIVI